MPTLSPSKQVKFIEQANTDLEKIKQAFALILDTPALASQVLGYPKNLEFYVDEKISNAQYDLWSQAYPPIQRPILLESCKVGIQELFLSPITAESVAKVEELLTNKHDPKAIISNWLNLLNLAEPKSIVKLTDRQMKENQHLLGITADVIFIALTLIGEEPELPQVITDVNSFSHYNSKNFLEIDGIEITKAVNKNITVKFPRAYVKALTAALN